jgi:hypothetical protein
MRLIADYLRQPQQTACNPDALILSHANRMPGPQPLDHLYAAPPGRSRGFTARQAYC